MRVGINNLALKSGHKNRGIGYYARNLIDGLESLGVEVVEFGEQADLGQVDLVHYPFFDLSQASLPLKKRFPTVVTIHDVTPLVLSKMYPLGIRGRVNLARQKLALKSVKAVITDSKSSKKDIEKYLRVPSVKVKSVSLAAADHFKVIKDRKLLESVRQKYSLQERFALYVGDVNGNKNLPRIGQAVKLVGVNLVMVGKSLLDQTNLDHPERRSFKQFLAENLDSPQLSILGFVSDEDLVAIYNLATVLLLPSLYEGFGLPILEAQKCGVPVITSNVSSMPEVAGDGALLVDPTKVAAIAEAIMKVFDQPKLASDLTKKGLENAKQYDFNKTAQATLEIYRDVVEKA